VLKSGQPAKLCPLFLLRQAKDKSPCLKVIAELKVLNTTRHLINRRTT